MEQPKSEDEVTLVVRPGEVEMSFWLAGARHAAKIVGEDAARACKTLLRAARLTRKALAGS